MIVFGRTLISSLFILGAINKLLNFQHTLNVMSQAGLPLVELLLPLTIALELFGGLLVLAGKRFHVEAAILLALFTLSTNLVFHDFWAMAEPERSVELSLFLKNLVVIGALLFVAGIGAKARDGN